MKTTISFSFLVVTLAISLVILYAPRTKNYSGVLYGEDNTWHLKTAKDDYILVLPHIGENDIGEKIINPTVVEVCNKLKDKEVIVRARKVIGKLVVNSIKEK